jgi:hypothetical protein
MVRHKNNRRFVHGRKKMRGSTGQHQFASEKDFGKKQKAKLKAGYWNRIDGVQAIHTDF